MQENDTPGVTVPEDVAIPAPHGTLFIKDTFNKPAQERVHNYSLVHVQHCIEKVLDKPEYLQFSSNVLAGMTQRSNVQPHTSFSNSGNDHFTLQDNG